MSPKVTQGATAAVCLVIAAVSFFGDVGPYGWIFGIVGLVLAGVAVVAMVRGRSIFGRPGPF